MLCSAQTMHVTISTHLRVHTALKSIEHKDKRKQCDGDTSAERGTYEW